MKIHVELNIYCLILYGMHINFNHFALLTRIPLHVILYVIDISLMNYLRYNVQFNILDSDKMSS